MTVYNQEKYLRQSIDSILNQTYQNFEFIIVDGGSTDATPSILKEYEKNDRVKIIIASKKLGIPESRNKGIMAANGEYIAVQDADDVSLPKRLEKQVEYLKKNEDVVLLGTSAYIVDEDNNILDTIDVPSGSENVRSKLVRMNCICHGSTMFRKNAAEKVGGYRELFKYSEDYDFYLRLIDKWKIDNLPEPLYIWRFSKNSTSVTKLNEQREYARLAKRFWGERKKYGRDSCHEYVEERIGKSSVGLLRKEIDPETFYRYGRCVLLTTSGRTREARREIRRLLTKRKLPISLAFKLLFYFMVSFFGVRGIKAIKKIRGHLDLLGAG